jgi:hypothetical protein
MTIILILLILCTIVIGSYTDGEFDLMLFEKYLALSVIQFFVALIVLTLVQ